MDPIFSTFWTNLIHTKNKLIQSCDDETNDHTSVHPFFRERKKELREGERRREKERREMKRKGEKESVDFLEKND